MYRDMTPSTQGRRDSQADVSVQTVPDRDSRRWYRDPRGQASSFSRRQFIAIGVPRQAGEEQDAAGWTWEVAERVTRRDVADEPAWPGAAPAVNVSASAASS